VQKCRIPKNKKCTFKFFSGQAASMELRPVARREYFDASDFLIDITET
jgi:hypothetical protein